MTGRSERGNFVSEWFGYRTYPQVLGDAAALRTQRTGRCPFLTAAVGEPKECVKSASSSGVCTISNASNGSRQDWLVCPYRALEPHLIESVVRRLFKVESNRSVMTTPAPLLAREETRAELLEHAKDGSLAIVYLQNKLGGEISVSATPHSPELSFDVTLVEMLPSGDGDTNIGRFGILEIQTMDFHGSYRRAVQNLKDSFRLHERDFAEVLQENQRWLSDRIEGPNIANVFKRTFYQMMLKFQIGLHPRSVGASLAIPQAVWDSWQPHLGRPDPIPRGDGTHALLHPDADGDGVPAWIHVFDLDAASTTHPGPIVVKRTIVTNAASIARFAIEEVPGRAFLDGGASGEIVATIRRRLSTWWPELSP